MAERIESGLAVIRPHPARSDTAKRQLADADLEDRMIDADPTGRRALDDPVDGVVATREHVQRERLVAVVHEPDCLVDVVDGEHRQDRPEDLLVHHSGIGLDPGEHGRRQELRCPVAMASAHRAVVAPGVEQGREPVPVTLVDDPAVVGRALRVVAVEVVNGAQQRAHQLVLDGRVDEHVVRCDTGLAGIEELAPCEAPSCHVDVGVGRDDGRALTPQFERDRRQILRGRRHHDPSDRGVAGVEDVIELLGKQRRRLLDAAGDDAHEALVEVLRDQLRHRGCCRRGHL